MRKVMRKVKSQWIVLGVMGATVVSLGTANVQKVLATEVDGVGVTETTEQLGITLTSNDSITSQMEEATIKEIPYATVEVADSNLEQGKTEVRQMGVNGVQNDTYAVIYTDGLETSRTLLSSVVTSTQIDEIIAVGTKDVTAPVIDISSISVSKQAVTKGETISISVNITDDSGIAASSIAYISPTTGQTETVYLYKNEISGLFEGNMTLTNATELGVWKASNIDAIDIYGNSASLANSNSDLSRGTFTVTGTNASDITGPVIESVQTSQESAVPGDTITVTLKATDDAGVSRGRVVYNKPSGEYYYLDLSLNETTGLLEGTIPIDGSYESGSWTVLLVYAYDTLNNEQHIGRYSTSADFTVSGTNVTDVTGPVIETVQISQKSAVPGDTITVTLKATDDAGVSRGRVVYNMPSGKYYYLDLILNEATGLLEGKIPIDGSYESGSWTVLLVYAYDTLNNEQHIGRYSTSADFIVSGTNVTDVTGPVIETVQISQKSAVPGDTITVTVKATDDAGVSMGRVVYNTPSGKYYYLDLNLNDATGLLEGTIPIDGSYDPGSWTVLLVYAYDTLNNEQHIGRYSNLADFTVRVLATEILETTEIIPYGTEKIDDATLLIGETKVIQSGLDGSRQDTYVVTSIDGIESKRELISSEITAAPINEITAVGTSTAYDQILSTKSVNYDATIIRGTDGINTQPWGTEGFQTIETSEKYLGMMVVVSQEKVTESGVTWALVSLDGQELGWIAKDALSVINYAQIVSETAVDYAATINRGTDAINTAPWGTRSYQTISSSVDYLGKTVDVSKEQVTDYGVTWALISLDGKELGWIAKDALTKNTYVQILSTTEVSYDAIITRSTDGINTKPWGTRGFETIGMSADYVNTEVTISQEQVAENGVTWALISKDGQQLGWIAKEALTVQNYAKIVSEIIVDYPAVISRGTDAINTAPWGAKGYQTISSSAEYAGKIVEVSKEQVTDYGVTWAQISLNGEVLGWIAKDALTVQSYAAIVSEKIVDYPATISRGTDAINAAPWGAKGYQNIGSSVNYVGKTVEVSKEQVTDYGVTWAQISLNGEVLGWIAKDALTVQSYAQIVSETIVDYPATISRGTDAINTAPWGAKGYQNIDSSANYVGETVEIIKEQVTDYGVTWSLVSMGGQELGWIAKDALTIRVYAAIVSETDVDYIATIGRGTDAINTSPWGAKGYQNIGSSADYVGKSVTVSKEQVTDYGVTWALVALDGKELGWIAKDALAVIVSVDSFPSASVTQNDAYFLPTTVVAYLSNNTTKQVDVVWDNNFVDTSNVGTVTFYGTVVGYNEKVSLTLDVVKYVPNPYIYNYSAITINNLSQSLALGIYNMDSKPISITKIEIYEQGRYFNAYTANDLINSGISAEIMPYEQWGITITYKLGIWLDNSYIKYYLESNGNAFDYTVDLTND